MKLILADYIVGIAFILMLTTHSVTHYLISSSISQEELAVTAKQLTTLVEQNPIAAWALASKKLSMLYSLVVVPSIFFGIYYYIRRKYIDRDKIIIEAFSFTLLIAFLINFLNDVTYLLVSFI